VGNLTFWASVFAHGDLAVGTNASRGGGLERMTPEEREQMNKLSKQLQETKDADEFTKLVRELIQLLQTKLNRLAPDRTLESR